MRLGSEMESEIVPMEVMRLDDDLFFFGHIYLKILLRSSGWSFSNTRPMDRFFRRPISFADSGTIVFGFARDFFMEVP